MLAIEPRSVMEAKRWPWRRPTIAAVQPDVIDVVPDLAPIVVLQPARRLRLVPWRVSQSKEFRRHYWSTGEAALRYRMSSATIDRRIRNREAGRRPIRSAVVCRPTRVRRLRWATARARHEDPGQGPQAPTDDDAETPAEAVGESLACGGDSGAEERMIWIQGEAVEEAF